MLTDGRNKNRVKNIKMIKVDEPISCIIPAYNELQNLEATVNSCQDTLERLFEEFEVIIVDDGSRDGTEELADRMAASDPRIHVVHHEKNMGYGAALKSGFATARKPLIFFTDADGQFNPQELEKFIPHLAENDMVVGFRSNRADALHRRIYGKLFSALIRIIFGINVRDINCAFKIFRRSILDDVKLTSPGALINTELLIIAKQKGIIPLELPVSHYPRRHGRQTGGSIKVILRAGRELLSLIYRFWLKGKE
jgi:glycosyltransferase involved in cell wall biosynthesis